MNKFIIGLGLLMFLIGAMLIYGSKSPYFVVCDLSKNTLEKIDNIPRCIPKEIILNGK